jgi:capsule polysaccharide export protein KpsE/RkpR
VNENKHILNLAKEAQKFNENMLKEKENLINELNAEKMENIKHLNEIDKLESEIVNLNYQKQLDNGTLEFKDILEPTEVQNEEN